MKPNTTKDNYDRPESHLTPLLLNDIEAAKLLGCSVTYLQQARLKRTGPPAIKLAKRIVRYSQPELLAWITSQPRMGGGSKPSNDASVAGPSSSTA
jgi:predicted DNA-binding transcriptional regulator AlpA